MLSATVQYGLRDRIHQCILLSAASRALLIPAFVWQSNGRLPGARQSQTTGPDRQRFSRQPQGGGNGKSVGSFAGSEAMESSWG